MEQTLKLLEDYNSSDDSTYMPETDSTYMPETDFTTDVTSETSYIDTEIDNEEVLDIVYEVQTF